MSNPRWGVYDKVDHCWIGGDDGPKTFGAGDVLPNGKTLDEDGAKVMARLMAEIVCHQVEGWDIGRLEARQIPPRVDKKKDEKDLIMTTEEVLMRKERGSLLT